MKRKGARSLKDISADILTQLNTGKIETVNLMEWLAIDQHRLLENVLIALKRENYFKIIEPTIQCGKKLSTMQLSQIIGEQLILLSIEYDDLDWLFNLLKHPSDAVRCWVCYSIAQHPSWTLKEKFEHILIPAQDAHFGVREVAWMAMRPHIIAHLDESIEILRTWVTDVNENIRRFASEATRPRGVWCAHIHTLREHPEKALPLLEPLAKDSSKYVQKSVGNWLNDASKSAPEFVLNICSDWRKLQNSDTDYMVKRALRTLNKN